jgi:hypothetical protein
LRLTLSAAHTDHTERRIVQAVHVTILPSLVSAAEMPRCSKADYEQQNRCDCHPPRQSGKGQQHSVGGQRFQTRFFYEQHFSVQRKQDRQMYIQHKNEAPSCNHCRSEMSITQPECVFVALLIQHAVPIHHTAICGLPHLQHFSTLSHKSA